MKIVIDNNVVLDALLKRCPFNKSAEQILLYCVDEHEGCITANSLTDIFYVLRKTLDVVTAKASIRKLMEFFTVLSVSDEDCLNALSLPIDDFEDALIVECAKKVNADFIVTRDKRLLMADALVEIIQPGTLAEMLKNI